MLNSKLRTGLANAWFCATLWAKPFRMSRHKLSLALAKVMIAAAWSDGEVQPEELTCLKDIILELPGMEKEDWTHLDVYISMPIEEDERLQLLYDLREEIKNDEDRRFIQEALQRIFMADGIVSGEEKRTIEQIHSVLNLDERQRY